MEVRTLLANLTVYLFLLLSSWRNFQSVNADCENFDFEDGTGGLAAWNKTGNAFNNQPTFGDNVHIRDTGFKTNVQGDWWIGTFEDRPNASTEGGYFKGDFPRGTLTSPKFLITGSNINFLLGGGCDAGKLRAELLVKGKVVRQAVADNCNDKMQRRRWDVSPFINKTAQIRLVDASRRGHINFDDFKGNFTCIGVPIDDDNDDDDENNDVDDYTEDNDDFTVTEEKEFPADTKNVEENSDGGLITGTEDEYKAMDDSKGTQDSGYTKEEDESSSTSNSEPGAVNDGELSTISTTSGPENGIITRVTEGKAISNLYGPEDGIKKAKAFLGNLRKQVSRQVSIVGNGVPLFKTAKLADKSASNTSHSGGNNASVPVNDELRNLTCKDYVTEIKTGKPWDNDFLFISNENYQATRREMEVRVLSAYEDDKDFRGAFFDKFSSSEEPDGIKAYFTLRFRAYGKFLGRLMDALGKENVTAAGCYVSPPAASSCQSSCPLACAPSCQPSCCQAQGSAAPLPQPFSQPAAEPMSPPPSPLRPQPSSFYQPAALQWNLQPSQTPAVPAQSQMMMWPGSQCSTRCSPSCAPSCSPLCCNYFNYKRKAGIAMLLKKEKLQEEKN